MTAAWMLFATIVAVLLAAAAVAAEQASASLGRPRRIGWAIAIAGSVVLPAVAWWRAAEGASASLTSAILPALRVNAGLQRMDAAVSGLSLRQVVGRLDTVLLAAWVVLSALLFVRLALAITRLARRRRTWRRASIDGAEVRFSSDVGPAVVGLRRMDIVLPEWTTTLDQPLRALVLRHEDEHRRAGDPALVLLGAVAVALMPWNLALHWSVRRLRLAIEMDCDARVLRAHPHAERYGLLLLTIAQRRAAPLAFAPALSEPVSHLERRILVMRRSIQRFSRTKMVLLLTAAAAAVVVACSVDAPKALGPRGTGNPSLEVQRTSPTLQSAGRPYFEFQVEKQAAQIPGTGAPRYPDLLRKAKVQGEVLVQFVLDTTGRAEMSTLKVVRSSHSLFTNSVKLALPNARFYPAEVGGRKVKQLVTMPYVFSLAR